MHIVWWIVQCVKSCEMADWKVHACTHCTGHGNDWVDSNVTDGKPTFRRRANLSSLSKICNHLGEIAAWSWKSSIVTWVFWKKTPLTGKFSQICSERIHHVSEPRLVCKFREIWLTGNRQSRALFTWQKKFPQALPLSLLRGSRPKSVKQYTRSSPNFIQTRSLPAEL